MKSQFSKQNTVFLLVLVPFFVLIAACATLNPEADIPVEEPINLITLAVTQGDVDGTKSISSPDIQCGGEVDVTIKLEGQNNIDENPVQVMLVLDRSGSMRGTPLTNLKTAAKGFVDLIDLGSDGSQDGVIDGSLVGVVSFSSSASLNQGLTGNANDVKNAINGLAAGGLTAIGDGINLAQAQFSDPGPHIMIVVTDGNWNTGANLTTAVNNAKGAGTAIYAIGFGGVSDGTINLISSDPDSQFSFINPYSATLEAVFEAIGADIITPADENIIVTDTVDNHFAISGLSATKGNVNVVGNVITWTIDKLESETATLTYTATHNNMKPGGVENVNDSVTYSGVNFGTVDVFPDGSIVDAVNVHGCAASLDLDPDDAINIVGENHTVTATVLDDFGYPVEGILVDFSVDGGPSVVDGDPSAPNPAVGTDTTDVNGKATFTYTNSEASPDMIFGSVTNQTNVSQERIDAGGLSDMVNKTWQPIFVNIDIKPGSDPNSYGATSRGKIPVALLGSATFDVSGVDDNTVLFGDAPSPAGDATIAHKKGHSQDSNGDAYGDRIYHFPFSDTNLDPSDTEGCLGGEVNGLDFLGCDAVNIVPK